MLYFTDTNWLLSHLKLFAQLERLIPHNDISFAPVLFILRGSGRDVSVWLQSLIPAVPSPASLVLSELNGLKNADAPQHDGLYSRHTPTVGSLARNASNFILDKLTHRPDLFRGQKAGEAGIQGAVQALKVGVLYETEKSSER